MNDTPAPAPTISAPSVQRFVEPTTKGDLSPAEAATMTKWIQQDLAAGKMTSEQANKALDELNASPEQRLPDSRSDEVRQLDQQFPVAKEGDYIVTWYPPGHAPAQMPKEVQALDASVRGWLHAAGATREHGNAIAAIVSRDLQRRAAMTAEQASAHKDGENLKRATLRIGLARDRLKPAGGDLPRSTNSGPA